MQNTPYTNSNVRVLVNENQLLNVNDTMEVNGTLNVNALTINQASLIGNTNGYSWVRGAAAQGIAFLVNGTTGATAPTGAAAVITSGGNVGIGTTTPAYPLDVVGSGEQFENTYLSLNPYASTNAQISVSGGRAYFGYDSSNGNAVVQGAGGKGIEFNVSNSTFASGTAAVLSSAGNLGIGTTSPYANLAIQNNYGSNNTTLFSIGSSTARNGSTASTLLKVSNTGALTLANLAGNANGVVYPDANGTLNVTAAGGAGTLCLIATNGGVPTWGSCAGSASTVWSQLSNPTGNLALSMGANTTTFTAQNTGSNNPFTFADNTSNAGTGILVNIASAASSAITPFQVSAVGNPALTVAASGNVGIGTTSPYANLSVMAGGNYASQAASTVFAIGSSTAGTATSTLFSVNSAGNTNIAGSLTVAGNLVSVLNQTGTGNVVYSASPSLTGGLFITPGPLTMGTSGQRGVISVPLANQIQIGPADVDTTAAMGAQILRSQGALAGGTADQAGVNWTFIASPGKGLGAGGSFVFQTVPAGLVSNTVVNAPVTALVINSAGLVGIGTTSPYAKLSVMVGGNYASQAASTVFAIGSSTAGTATSTLFSINSSGLVTNNGSETIAGKLGINNTNPQYTLDVAGFINTDQYSGYKQAGNTVLYASTTNASLAVGASSAAAWMAASPTLLQNVAIGVGALAATPAVGSPGDQYNTAIGYNALNANTTGSYNFALGSWALLNNTSGVRNTALGTSALYTNNGSYNSAFGMNALYSNTTGSNNTVFGYSAIRYASAVNNVTAIGYQAVSGGTTFSNQGGTYVGYGSGYSAGTNSDYNTFLGYQAGYPNTTGFDNILIGAQKNTIGAGYLSTGGDNIGIGFNTLFPSATANNQLNIGNFLYGTLPATTTASTFGLPTTGNFGIATTTSALFGIHANNGASYSSLFMIGSSTASATTTLFTVLNTGSVGIGTTSPQWLLSLSGGGQRIKETSDILNAFSIENSVGSTTVAADTIDTSGNIFSVATSSGTDYFDVAANGNIALSTSVYSTCSSLSTSGGVIQCSVSDQRLKQNITTLAPATGLAAIDALNPVSYTFIDPTRPQGTQYGLIAQQVQQVLPALVATSSPTALTPDGTLTVNYDGLIAPLIEAVQQLDARTKGISNSASSTVMTFDISGNVGLGVAPSAADKLTVGGNIFAQAYEVPAGTVTAYTFGAASGSQTSSSDGGSQTSFAAPIPSVVLTAGGRVDLYKLATYNLSGISALAVRLQTDEMRLTSLEARVAELENGSIAVSTSTPFSTSTLASAFSGLGAYIQQGIAQFGILVADQFVAATNSAGTSSAGTVTIPAGNTVAVVTNAYVNPASKIFVTFTASTTASWYISDKQNGSFKLILSAAPTSDISFDYFIVQTQGQIATSTPVSEGGQTFTNPQGLTSQPVITLLGDNPLHLSVGGTFVEPGVSVHDSDGTNAYVTFVNGVQETISSTTLDTSSPTTYIITYSATDSSGNTATARRSVIIGNPDGTVSSGAGGGQTLNPNPQGLTSSAPADTTPPVVTLNGSAALTTSQGTTFTDPGATATDDTDGDLTSKIKETGTVDTTTLGLYTLTYSATDSAGNTGTASRVVSVVAAPSAPSDASTTPAG